MDWNLDKKRPICPQICEQICVMIAIGELNTGDRLMSVRDIALVAGVTPNTVQKSFEQLELKGVIYSKRGSGWYVSDDTGMADELLADLIKTKTEAYINEMNPLGLDIASIIDSIKENGNE